MAFDPNQFLSETAPTGSTDSSGFDPKAFLEETAPELPIMEGTNPPKQSYKPEEIIKSNPTNTEMLGAAARGIVHNVLPEVEEIPDALRAVYGAGKGLYESGKNLLTGKNYSNVINSPKQGAIGAAKGIAKLPFDIASGMLQTNPNFKDIIANQGIDPKTLPDATPNMLKPKNEAQESGSKLAESALNIGMVAAPLAKMGVEKIYSSPNMTVEKSLSLKNRAIKEGVDKGIKPSVKTSNKKYQNTDMAVNTIDKNLDKIDIKDEKGNSVDLPETAAHFESAIDQAQDIIFNEYNDAAIKAGENVSFEVSPIVKKLEKVAAKPGEDLPRNDPRLQYEPSARDYAYKKIQEIKELDGSDPKIIQERIKALNQKRHTFYEGKNSAMEAMVDAGIANEMRKQLDQKIESTTGTQYQDLKNQYGALTAIKNEVHNRAATIAKQPAYNMFDLANVFNSKEILIGAITHNPVMLGTGLTGKAIMAYEKHMNNPNTYIKRMFQVAHKHNELTKPKINPNPEISTNVDLPKGSNLPAYFRKGIIPESKQEAISQLSLSDSQLGKLSGILEDFKKNKISNPELDNDLLTNKLINEVSDKKTPGEVDDLLASIESSMPVGEKNKTIPETFDVNSRQKVSAYDKGAMNIAKESAEKLKPSKIKLKTLTSQIPDVSTNSADVPNSVVDIIKDRLKNKKILKKNNRPGFVE